MNASKLTNPNWEIQRKKHNAQPENSPALQSGRENRHRRRPVDHPVEHVATLADTAPHDLAMRYDHLGFTYGIYKTCVSACNFFLSYIQYIYIQYIYIQYIYTIYIYNIYIYNIYIIYIYTIYIYNDVYDVSVYPQATWFPLSVNDNVGVGLSGGLGLGGWGFRGAVIIFQDAASWAICYDVVTFDVDATSLLRLQGGVATLMFHGCNVDATSANSPPSTACVQKSMFQRNHAN